MNWLRSNDFVARPLVAVEDHVYHISELLKTIQQSDTNLLSQLTIVCLDRSGPDTDAAVLEWLANYPQLQIATRLHEFSIQANHRGRVELLDEDVFTHQSDYCKKIASLIRRRGLLLQDIDLETLQCVPRERWWETTVLASTVRGIVGERPPKCAFISNKRGYEATFGAELLAAGHDPRDVLNKYEMERVVVPFLARHLRGNFSASLYWCAGDENGQSVVNTEPSEVQEVNDEFDLVLWPAKNQSIQVGGKALAKTKKPNLILPIDSNEASTWSALINSHLAGQSGLEVQEVGQRVATAGALRAEVTNAAARHIHSLRKRLTDSQSILTVQGRYQLAGSLAIARVDS